jgi:type II secretory pathway component GspD/PulD (secretin)
LLRLDENIDDRRLVVVRLRNTQAASVAAAVQQYLTGLQQQFAQLVNTTISANESVERQVFVIAENVTNSLIVSATPRYQEEILNVIKELDVRPPMVMVQVLIAEVTLSNTFEFGTEFGFQDSLVFDRGKAVGSPPGSENPSNPGFNFNGNPIGPGPYPNIRSYQQEALAGQSLSNFAVGRASELVPYSGLVLSAASESVSILLRALQDEGRLQILSRPQIMTMHNQPAYVQVGANVARPGESTISAGVAQQSVIYENTGLILSILPLINDDGVIVMGIEAERSALGSELDPNAQDIPTGVNNQIVTIKPLNISKASTTISARDGQTVVFAGLITKQNQIRLRRIPYLSDVPVLGNLFKYESDEETRSELLVVMTPYLVRDDEDVETIKLRETERMSWCLSDVVNLTGDWGLQPGNCAFCKGDSPMIFPDIDPTGTMTCPVHTVPTHSYQSATESAPAGLGDPNLQPLPPENNGIVGPPVPEFEARRSTRVIYGPPPAEPAPAPAHLRLVRLPAPR